MVKQLIINIDTQQVTDQVSHIKERSQAIKKSFEFTKRSSKESSLALAHSEVKDLLTEASDTHLGKTVYLIPSKQVNKQVNDTKI